MFQYKHTINRKYFLMDNFTVAVTIGSRDLKVTSDGTEEGTVFDGKVGDVKIATASAKRQDPVSFGKFGESPIANSGYDSPIALTAALYSISPEMVRLVEAPKEVYEFLNLSPESNPEVTDNVAIDKRAVNSKVLGRDVSSLTTMETRYSGTKIKVVQQNGIYGEVAISTVISMVCIIYFCMLVTNSFLAYNLDLKEMLENTIALIATPLAIYCSIISVIKLFKNNDFLNFSYMFVVLFLALLPFLFLFTPDAGFVPQLIDNWADHRNYNYCNDACGGGPWRG